MCFLINSKKTAKLRAKKTPIIAYKFVWKMKGKKHAVSGYSNRFTYPVGATKVVKIPCTHSISNHDTKYGSKTAHFAGSGIYAYLSRTSLPVDSSTFINKRFATLEIDPKDILGVGEGKLVARKVKVLSVSTPRAWAKTMLKEKNNAK